MNSIHNYFDYFIKNINNVQLYNYKTYIVQSILYNNFNYSGQTKMKNYTDDLLDLKYRA